MIGLLFLFVIFIVLSAGVNAMGDMAKNTQCNLHKWDFDAEGQMYCRQCRIKPGDNF